MFYRVEQGNVNKYVYVTLIVIGLVFIYNCQSSQSRNTNQLVFNDYCGSCHLAPDPTRLTQYIWDHHVLPNMAYRLGYEFEAPDKEFNFFVNSDIYEQKNKQLSSSDIDSVSWNRLRQYIMDLAPPIVISDSSRVQRTLNLDQFIPKSINLDGDPGISLVSSIDFDSISKTFLIGDGNRKMVASWPTGLALKSKNEIINFNSPVVSSLFFKGVSYILEIGELMPSDNANGVLYRIDEEGVQTIAKNLHRPVSFEIVDLDQNGLEEFIICEFGNQTGKLSLFVKEGEEYKKIGLLDVPGTTKIEVEDMNGDGRTDVVVLASQGNEGIYILYNKGDLKFEKKQVIQLPPEFGSSWFELVDYNGDGNLDIFLSNGDNGDISVMAKNFHGVRLFLNLGNDEYNETWFYPIYGATKLIVNDFDLDGDFDLAVISFFPEYAVAPNEGFVYLENIDSDSLNFNAHTFSNSADGRWMVMEDGDIDGDGDVDLLIGSYAMSLGQKYRKVYQNWQKSTTNLVLLENKSN